MDLALVRDQDDEKDFTSFPTTMGFYIFFHPDSFPQTLPADSYPFFITLLN